MPLRIVVTATARAQIRAIARWWREHRPAEPALFIDELEAALGRISALPWSGSPYPIQRPAGTRRMLLQQSSHHVYYTIHPDEGTVIVRAVWHTARGRGPSL